MIQSSKSVIMTIPASTYIKTQKRNNIIMDFASFSPVSEKKQIIEKPQKANLLDLTGEVFSIGVRAALVTGFLGVIGTTRVVQRALTKLTGPTFPFPPSGNNPSNNKRSSSNPIVGIPTPHNPILAKIWKKTADILYGIIAQRVNTTVPPFAKRVNIDEIKKILKPGDIIVCARNDVPGWSASLKLLFNSDWVHWSLYTGNNKCVEAYEVDKKLWFKPIGNNKFREATPEEALKPEENGLVKIKGIVCENDTDFILNRETHISIVRPKYKTSKDTEASVNYAKDQLGKNYDENFDIEDDTTHFCLEVVYDALKKGPNPIKLETSPLLKLPSPDILFKSKDIEVVYTDKNLKNNFWENMKTTY